MNATAIMNPPAALPEAVYLLGVGGMGMAPLAVYLAQAGVAVTGWDDGLRPEVAALLHRHGVALTREPPADARVCARSSAIAEDHPLCVAAQAQGARVIRRGELLAEVTRGHRLLAVVGSHGKTTTTGMLIHLLGQAGLNCGYVLGGLFRGDAAEPACYVPGADWVVAEIDESDGTVEGFSPEVTVAVNFDWDHADRYASAEDLRQAFARLFARTRTRVLVPEACAELTALAPVSKTLRCKAKGGFNAANAAMALAAAREMGAAVTPHLLDDFPGIRRRQDVLYTTGGVTLVADYAHHPTEVSALLHHATQAWPGRLLVVFQPHRYSRTRQFAAAFAEALAPADQVWLLPVYAASEAPLDGGQSVDIARASGQAWPVLGVRELPAVLDQALREQPATVLFVGAGDIDDAARAFVRDWTLARQWRAALAPDSWLSLGEPLAPKTTLRVGGPARFYAEPASESDLICLLDFAAQSEVPWFMLGRGSNLIVADDGFPGLVIHLRHEAFREFEPLGDGRVRVGAGLPLKRMCGLAAKAGLAGFEFLEGIPGTVGGALRMNAGAAGGWMFDVVERVRYLDERGQPQEASKAAFHVDYRRCDELARGLALEAVLVSGQRGTPSAIREQMDAYAHLRRESQPREPSAGCIFKNPDGGHAGKIIDKLGLKGLRIGDAEVSPVHANFIVNHGGACAEDVLSLVREIRAVARRERGVELEPEALLVGRKWKEVL